jgi:hypothetical protein
MQTTTLPEIDEADLKAVREFLTSLRDEQRAARTLRTPLGPHGPLSPHGAIPVRNGITRARTRSGSKTTT